MEFIWLRNFTLSSWSKSTTKNPWSRKNWLLKTGNKVETKKRWMNYHKRLFKYPMMRFVLSEQRDSWFFSFSYAHIPRNWWKKVECFSTNGKYLWRLLLFCHNKRCSYCLWSVCDVGAHFVEPHTHTHTRLTSQIMSFHKYVSNVHTKLHIVLTIHDKMKLFPVHIDRLNAACKSWIVRKWQANRKPRWSTYQTDQRK